MESVHPRYLKNLMTHALSMAQGRHLSKSEVNPSSLRRARHNPLKLASQIPTLVDPLNSSRFHCQTISSFYVAQGEKNCEKMAPGVSLENLVRRQTCLHLADCGHTYFRKVPTVQTVECASCILCGYGIGSNVTPEASCIPDARTTT